MGSGCRGWGGDVEEVVVREEGEDGGVRLGEGGGGCGKGKVYCNISRRNRGLRGKKPGSISDGRECINIYMSSPFFTGVPTGMRDGGIWCNAICSWPEWRAVREVKGAHNKPWYTCDAENRPPPTLPHQHHHHHHHPQRDQHLMKYLHSPAPSFNRVREGGCVEG